MAIKGHSPLGGIVGGLEFAEFAHAHLLLKTADDSESPLGGIVRAESRGMKAVYKSFICSIIISLNLLLMFL